MIHSTNCKRVSRPRAALEIGGSALHVHVARRLPLPPPLCDQFAGHVPSGTAQSEPRGGVPYVNGGGRLEGTHAGHRWLQGIQKRWWLLLPPLLLRAVVVVVVVGGIVHHLRDHGRFVRCTTGLVFVVVVVLALGRNGNVGGHGPEGQAIDPKQLQGTPRIIVFGNEEPRFLGFGHDRRQFHDAFRTVPAHRLAEFFFQPGPLDGIVLVVGPIGSGNHRLWDPSAVDPDHVVCVCAHVCVCVCACVCICVSPP
mmetsp:Transcript_11223/g.22628  ORF Transcript_11223/g.22628 Transcript_11223/m.22628 type:complete len:253 (+) Transcript_11223:153-911(+)